MGVAQAVGYALTRRKDRTWVRSIILLEGGSRRSPVKLEYAGPIICLVPSIIILGSIGHSRIKNRERLVRDKELIIGGIIISIDEELKMEGKKGSRF